MRAPKPSDLLWFAILAFAVAAFRMFFAPDAAVPCQPGTSCYDASLPLPADEVHDE